MTKIDRAMVNNQWFDSNIYAIANFLPAGCLSDHSPCVVTLFHQEDQRKRSFKFFNMWTDHDEFLSIVDTGWNRVFHGSAQFCLTKKLKALKGDLKKLNRLHFSHISSRAQKANSDLYAAEMLLQNDPTNTNLQQDIIQLRKSALKFTKAEKSFLQQKAKNHYILNSDKSNKFFHSIVKRNQKKNFIAAITLADGSVSSSTEQVASAFVDFYADLLGARVEVQTLDSDILLTGPCLSQDQCAALISPVSDIDIKAALDSIDANKAPGPDGYTSQFFKKAWNIVGPLFSAAVMEFFRNSSLLKQLNHTLIALIPKTSHVASVGDYRPISCCNVVYKVISKILSARLALTLSSIIDKTQSGFVPGRLMSDNIHLMQELLRGYDRKRTSPRCIIKIDLRKAYDSISWDFLHDVLVALKFPQVFIGWIMECVTTTSFSVCINGHSHGLFKGGKGLRQGDPLSPYLFIICMEYLSRLINKQTQNPDFNFHPKCGSLKITHLAFADDLMLLARGDHRSIEILMDCMQDFGSKSGLFLNVLKSNMFTAGLNLQEANDIKGATHLIQGVMPFRYLGIPLAASNLRVMHFGPLIHQIADSISSWSGCNLSYAGRLELIRSVLQGIQCFWLSIFPIPASVQNQITSLCRKFLWNHKKPLVGWNTVCLPKSDGGPGLKDIKAWNNALLSKLLWNIMRKKDSLWIKWINQVYMQNRSVWEWSVHPRDSALFKRVFAIRDSIIQ